MAEGLDINFVGSSRYLGDYLGTRQELDEWVKPQVQAWANRVIVLNKIAKRNP